MRVHVLAVLLQAWAGFAQVSSVKPTNHWSGGPLGLFTSTRVEVSHNAPEAIRRELLDTNTVRVISDSTGLGKDELSTIAIALGPDGDDLWLYQVGTSERARKTYSVFSEKLQFYVWGRLGGHTRGFLLNALTNHIQRAATSDPDLHALLEQRPDLAGSPLERCDSGFYTNQLEVVFRRVKYSLRDAEVAWCYDFYLTRGGTAFNISEWKTDAKEFDPKFRTVIEEVEKEASAEMKQKGMFGKFGSAHSFWRLKKEKLKAKGIAWRSPEELNPGVTID
jgi:hypothetical protein